MRNAQSKNLRNAEAQSQKCLCLFWAFLSLNNRWRDLWDRPVKLNCNVWLLASNARIHLDSEIQTSSGNPSRDNDDDWIIEVQAAWQCYARDQ